MTLTKENNKIKRKKDLLLFIVILSLIILNLCYTNKLRKLKNNINVGKCYISPLDTNLKIVHLIITRFMIEFYPFGNFRQKIYTKGYILNGIRVMKKYLLPSLDNQSCKNFIWILKIGDKADIDYIKSLMNFDNLFEKKVVYEKDIKNYLKEMMY